MLGSIIFHNIYLFVCLLCLRQIEFIFIFFTNLFTNKTTSLCGQCIKNLKEAYLLSSNTLIVIV